MNISTPNAVAVGRRWLPGTGGALDVRTPIDGSLLASFPQATPADLKPLLAAATSAFLEWRMVPAPVRGEFVRRIGEKLREKKDQLAAVVSWEAGKITQESLGEVQEMIDICDFAVGLSRQLYGLTIASERPRHRLMEQWHPLGPVGVITAFNFPVAVWAWNAMLGLVCGDPIIWKPSHKTPLCALATHAVVMDVLKDMPDVPDGVVSLIVGGNDVGEALAAAPELPLISATGSTRMGRTVGQVVAARLGRSLLELGGNNAMIVAPTADLELAVRSITFAAVGTCGQRCTTLRRLIVHESIAATLLDRLKAVYAKLPIGNPLEPGTLVGPLIDEAAFEAMQSALASARQSGGTVTGGERVLRPGGYVSPALVEIAGDAPIVREETFAPILYVTPYRDLSDAIALHNGVPQGLASAILTNDLREAELFLSPAGSDCGIANVNIGTSGAEIGGAFGGEKATGGGRESGSDAWKVYMRRATNTINYSRDLPLAQGIRFEV
ncbi:L-piperidine-6-carboxylate dehydrogenase [Limnoglobus roseus]|uniref:L-piperidine-6-carboxylate dehydrogenase n=1 Tax=Limnoglobus roseus TaxID=2598579 RepID=UPI0036F42CDC